MYTSTYHVYELIRIALTFNLVRRYITGAYRICFPVAYYARRSSSRVGWLKKRAISLITVQQEPHKNKSYHIVSYIMGIMEKALSL